MPSTQAPPTASGSPSSTDETGDIDERSLRDEIENFPQDGDLSDLVSCSANSASYSSTRATRSV